MTYQVSPGVYDREFDLTQTISAATASVNAFVGNFKWGPVEQIIPVSSEKDALSLFTKPDLDTQVDFLTLTSYLAYSNQSRVVRAYSPTALNATTADAATPGAGTGLLVKNDDAYSNMTIPDGIDLIARHPGDLGNGIRAFYVFNEASYQDLVTKAGAATNPVDKAIYQSMVAAIGRRGPNTTDFAAAYGASNDELHAFVFDYAGKFSGVAGTLLESFLGLSQASNAKANDGTSQYYVQVINQQSQFIRWGSHPSILNQTLVGTEISGPVDFAPVTPITTLTEYTFGGGSNGVYPLTDADYIAGYDLFKNKDTVDVFGIIMGARTSVPTLHVIQNIAEYRKDCVVYCSVPAQTVIANQSPLDDVIAYRDVNLVAGSTVTDTLGGYSSSYAFLDNNWKYMFNKYSNTSVWVPCSGDTAGLAAQTDKDRDPWYSPAGYNRGNVKNAIKLAWNADELARDDLFKAQINPIVSFPGNGPILFGDATLQVKTSFFSQLGVRKLFIILRKTISNAAKYSLFEFNDEFSRAQFVSLVDPLLRDVKGRRGITKYKVQCDEKNNPAEVINTFSFVGDIFVVPNVSTRFIRLNFIAVPNGVDFNELEGNFG